MTNAKTESQIIGQKNLNIAVAICSVGRPDHLGQTLKWLTRQTKMPSTVVLVVSEHADLPKDICSFPNLPLEVLFSKKGLTRQRNAALETLLPRSDVIFFIDDDYAANNAVIAELEKAFWGFPDVSGVTGRLLLDGVNVGGVRPRRVERLIHESEISGQLSPCEPIDLKRQGLYGCNMAFRTAAIGETRFDERLPLYGWQEDVDFSNRVDGRNIRIDSVIGIHCGTPLGRETNGIALGYSQIANPIYLVRKGTMDWQHAARIMVRNFAANFGLALLSEPWINRSARLKGNISALLDMAIGKLTPIRILTKGPS